MKNFKRFLEEFNELLGLPFALAAFFLVPVALYLYFGPETGAPDPGNISILSWAALLVIFASLVAYWGARLNFPGFYRAFQDMQHDLTFSATNFNLICAFSFVAVYVFYFLVVLWLLVKLMAPGQ